MHFEDFLRQMRQMNHMQRQVLTQNSALLHVQEKSFQVLAFRVVDVHGVVTRLVETVKDADAAATLGGC